MKKVVVSLFAGIVSSAVVQSSTADTTNSIALWTFETSTPANAGPFSPEVGSGSASGSHAGAAVYSSPSGNGSTHSFSANTWAVGDYYEFDVSTLDFSGIQISFDQTSSNTGPGIFGLFYSVNGGAYSQIGANYSVLANASPNPTWNPTTYSRLYTFSPDLSSTGTALNNATTISFRLVDESTVSANGGTVAAAGTDRVDNFDVFTVTSVPEPSTIALAGSSSVACLLAFRRRK